MKIILSPAKSLDLTTNHPVGNFKLPVFLKRSEVLVQELRKMSSEQISTLMKISPQLGELNFERYHNFKLPFTEQNTKQAALVFKGPAYQGLDFSSLKKTDQTYANKVLYILSGLYGILKPLDAIQAYRLEMGTRFPIDSNTNNLYQFWGNQIVDYLNHEIKTQSSPILVNLASNEYAKAALLKKVSAEVITPVFKDQNKSGEYKTIMAFAKRARGLMARFIIQNRITKVSELKHFDIDGYCWSSKESRTNQLVFLRKKSAV